MSLLPAAWFEAFANERRPKLGAWVTLLGLVGGGILLEVAAISVALTHDLSASSAVALAVMGPLLVALPWRVQTYRGFPRKIGFGLAWLVPLSLGQVTHHFGTSLWVADALMFLSLIEAGHGRGSTATR